MQSFTGEQVVAKAGRGSDAFVVRLPDGLRGTLKDLAERNGRSMNAEIVARIEFSLSRDRARSFEINDVQAMYIEAISSENDALRRLKAISEPLLIQCALALGKAADGDDADLQTLIRREKQHSILQRISRAPSDEESS